MFSPPDKSHTGVLQFRQYVRWVESVLDCSIHDDAEDDELPLHHRIASARRVCDRLRDGVLLNALMTHIETAAGHAPTQDQPHRKVAGPTAEAARLLLFARQRFITLLTSDEFARSTGTSGIVSTACIHSERDVPPIHALYGGNYEALSLVLFYAFHVGVVRERFRMAPSMCRWYRSVAERYDIACDIPLSCDCGEEQFDLLFHDGLLWICALHNTSSNPIDLSAVYRHPTTTEQRASNLTFVYSQFELHSIFTYFPTLQDFLERRNGHFLYMQCFHVFQCLERVALRHVDVETLSFMKPTRNVAAKDTSIRSPKLARSKTPVRAVSSSRGAALRRPVPRKDNDALMERPEGHHHTTPLRPTQLKADKTPAAPVSLPTKTPRATTIASSVTAAEPHMMVECRIVAGTPSHLTLHRVAVTSTGADGVHCIAFLVLEREGTLPLGTTYRIPGPPSRCSRGRGTSVIITYPTVTPTAPPPYHTSHCPAITLFFDTLENMDVFLRYVPLV